MFTKDSNKRKIDYGLILIAMICGVTLFYCFSNGISGNDFWWHVKVGQWICTNRQIPTSDIFSWYGVEMNIPWTAHEWLSDVVYYAIHRFSGNIGIYIFSISAALSMIILLWKTAATYIKENVLISGLFFALLSVVTSSFFYGRPHVFGFFFLYIELKLLYEFLENQESKKIYFIPLIACLWSNFHGGSSVLSYLLCIIFLLTGLIKCDYGRVVAERLEKKALIRLGIVTACTIVAILVNPIGLKVLIYPFMNQGDKLMISIISEWQAPDAKSFGAIIMYFLPILLISIGFVTENKKIRLIDLLMKGMFLFLFFRSVRFIILWYIVAIFYGFRYMPKCKVKEVTKKAEKIIIVLFMLFLLLLAGMSIKKIIGKAREDSLISEVLSKEMLQVVKEDMPSRIFNDYNLGEALIYNDIPVFFDARADLFAEEQILANGVSLMFLEQANDESEKAYVDVDGLIEGYGFDTILILKSRPLYSYMKGYSHRFISIYEDDTAGYFRICQ